MLSDLSKSAFKMASEDPQKILLKEQKTWNCPASLVISEALRGLASIPINLSLTALN